MVTQSCSATRGGAVQPPTQRNPPPSAIPTRRVHEPNRAPAPAAPVIRERSLSGETFDEVSVVVHDNGNDDDGPPPALKSPIKSRAHAIATSVNKKTDLDIWNMSDNDILGSDIFPYYALLKY